MTVSTILVEWTAGLVIFRAKEPQRCPRKPHWHITIIANRANDVQPVGKTEFYLTINCCNKERLINPSGDSEST